MGVKKDSRALLVNAPEGIGDTLHLPALDIATKMTGDFDYIHLFITTQKKLDQQFSKLKKHLRSTGTLWVSWPKAKQLNTDLDIKSVIKIGYDHGLVESRNVIGFTAGDQIAVNDTFLVNPVRAGVAQIRFKRGPRCHTLTLGDARIDQGPGTVADRRDRFAGITKGFDERDGRVGHP